MPDELLAPQKSQDLEQNINQGVNAPTVNDQKVQGFLDMSQFPIVSPDGNNDKFLSDFDPQYQFGFDTLGCNIFASIGNCEANINAMGGDPDYQNPGEKVEFSERKACVDAGLNGLAGSSEQQWEDAINQFGLVKHNDWSWASGMTQPQFFSPETPDIISLGKKFLNKYTPFHRQILTNKLNLVEALKYGPIKIFVGTGPGWNVAEPSVVPINTGFMNHAVLLRYIDDTGYHIRDQYPPFLKVLHPDYKIFFAFQTLFLKKTFHYTFNYDLQYGMSNADCVMLQMALRQDGEFPTGIEYNQHFGPVTLKAVQAFQVKYNIAHPGDIGFGRVGPKTRGTLNNLYRT